MTRKTIIISALAFLLAAGGAHAKGHDQSQAASDARTGPRDGTAPGDNVEVTTSSAKGLGFFLGNRPTEMPPGQGNEEGN